MSRDVETWPDAGHVLPGIIFLSWGIYWTMNAFTRYFKSQANGVHRPPKPWYPCLVAGRWLYALEPFLKVLGGPIGISIELYFDSHNGFR